MGWNCTLTLVAGASLADLARVGWVPGGETVPFEHAVFSAYAGVAAWQRGPDLVLVSSSLDLAARTEDLALLGPVHSALFQASTDTYVWQVPGPDGGRTWVWSMFEEQLDEGEAHPAEAGLDHLDEETLSGLLAAAGLAVDAELTAAAFVSLTDLVTS